MLKFLQNLKIVPKNLENNNYSNGATFDFSPLPVGLGLTLGTYLRRSLFNNVPGLSPFAAQISFLPSSEDSKSKGPINREFVKTFIVAPSGLGIVQDSISELVYKKLSLLDIRKKKEFKNSFSTITLSVENNDSEERKVFAGDFVDTEEIEVVNKEIHIFDLASGKNIQIELFFKEGIGSEDKNSLIKNFPNYSDYSDLLIFENGVIYTPVLYQLGVKIDIKQIVTLKDVKERLELTFFTKRSTDPKTVLSNLFQQTSEFFAIFSSKLNEQEKINSSDQQE